MLVLLLSHGCTQPAQNATLQFGDKALVDYILIVDMGNGTVKNESVYSTSIESVARSARIYKSGKTYEPLLVSMANNNGLLPAFTRALVGMQEGENKTFLLQPEDGYGLYDPGKRFSIQRFYEKPRLEEIPTVYLLLRNVSTEAGTNLTTSYGSALIVNSTNSSVTVMHFPQANSAFFFNGFPQRVAAFDNDTITLEVLVNVGSTYHTKTSFGTNVTVRAVAENDTDITLDANGPLAGEIAELYRIREEDTESRRILTRALARLGTCI